MQFVYKLTSLVSEKEIETSGKQLDRYIDYINDVILEFNYDVAEASLVLPAEYHFINDSKQLAQLYKNPELRLIIIIGIGGSNLGTRAIYDALEGHFSPIKTEDKPTVLFLDTLNKSFISQLAAYIKKNNMKDENYVVNIISKSGTTTETVMNYELIAAVLPQIVKRTVVTTDKGSKLDILARELNMPVLTIPKNVGGRYSVLSNVGLFPLSLMGFDVEQLLKGALDAREKNISNDIHYNPAALSAAILYSLYKKGYVINDNFFFNAELESIGKWYRQLMGESIGKEGKGILPTVYIGSTDLHSMVQLYLGG